jgi:GNAT superfamily N-acetyltransferase
MKPASSAEQRAVAEPAEHPLGGWRRHPGAGCPDFTLRAAQEGDVPFLLHLREVAMDPHHHAAGIFQTPAEMEERVRSHWDEAQVVELDGRLVGLWKLWRQPEVWWILQVQLLPEAQGRGIGAELIRRLIAEADAAGVALKLKVLKTNPARRLYERLGFVLVGDDEHGHEMLWVSTPLSSSS